MDSNGLCPTVKYPVPVGTPQISPLVQWDHAQTWDIPKAEDFLSGSGGSNSSTVYNIGEKCTSRLYIFPLVPFKENMFIPAFTFYLTDVNPESADHYLIGHCIDGRVLYPATGYLVLAWRTLVRSLGVVMEATPITFEDVTIHRATILPKTGEKIRTVWLCEIFNDGGLISCLILGVLVFFFLHQPVFSLHLSVRLCPVRSKSHACHQEV